MSQQNEVAQLERVAFWRKPSVRAILYQVIALAIVIVSALTIYKNTLTNLAQRGMKTGFGFLTSEAGFKIGEIVTLPLPSGGFLYFLIAIAVGIIGVALLSRYQRSIGKKIGDSTTMTAVAVTLVVIIPGLLLFLFHGSIETFQYSESSNYIGALVTGLMNTLKVSIIACVLSTVLGLMVALAGLSPNFMLSRMARYYVEINRNIPLLMQLFFWYFIVFQGLPNVRKSIDVCGLFFLNNRGLFVPKPTPESSAALFIAAVVLALVGVFFILRRARKIQDKTGEPVSVFFPSVAVLLGLPALVWLFGGAPFSFEIPVLKGFNYSGGMVLTPEFTALTTGLTIYVSAFNAEIIRSGIQSVSRGQKEAGHALALGNRLVMRLVVLPQALRVIVPPMINEYLAVTKSSSLAVAIGYPDVVSVGGTILNQTGQSIEIIGIWMGVYLILSLSISLGMNVYNSKIKLVER